MSSCIALCILLNLNFFALVTIISISHLTIHTKQINAFAVQIPSSYIVTDEDFNAYGAVNEKPMFPDQHLHLLVTRGHNLITNDGAGLQQWPRMRSHLRSFIILCSSLSIAFGMSRCLMTEMYFTGVSKPSSSGFVWP